MIFYFSGCGNSRWIAQEIAAATGEELRFIPELQRAGFQEYHIHKGESLGFVYPVYSWAPPMLVEEFVLNIHWTGTPAYTWFACTCGDEMGYTRKLFSRTLTKAGLTLNASFCFIMPETYLAMPGFKLDKPQKAQQKIAAAREKLPLVIADIQAKKTVIDEHIGSMPRLKSYLIRPGFVKNANDKKFFSTDECNGCGTCARLCPLQNIVLPEGNPIWEGHCTQCMSCYHHCPKNAIQCGTYTQGKGQYFFRNNN